VAIPATALQCAATGHAACTVNCQLSPDYCLTGLNWNASVYSSVRGVYWTFFLVAHIVNWKWIGM